MAAACRMVRNAGVRGEKTGAHCASAPGVAGMAADPPTPRIFPLPQAATSAVARAVARNVPTASARAVTARAVAPVRVPALARGLARGGARRARASFAVCAAGESLCRELKGGETSGRLIAGGGKKRAHSTFS